MNIVGHFRTTALLTGIAMTLCGGVFAQNAGSSAPGLAKSSSPVDGFQPPSSDEIELLRKDLRSEKKQIIAANLKLTEKEAEKFWPVYDQYAEDYTKITDRKVALIRHYAENYNTLSDEQAEEYIRGRAQVEESLIQLREKYLPVFRRVLSGKSTARFFQIDWRMAQIIDLQVASQMPLVEPTTNTP